MSAADTLFKQKAPWIMGKLLGDFPIVVDDSGAIVGNLGHECLGFTKLQEMKPVVKGSRGGYGWPQWTGPRRRAYEAYCKRNDLDPASDKANYAYLFIELKGSERKAIPATVAADGLNNKVIAFEKSFLRAGVKHYPSRQLWARKAMTAYADAGAPLEPTPIEEKRDILVEEAEHQEAVAKGKTAGAAAGAGTGGTGVVVHQGLQIDWNWLTILGLTTFAVVGLFLLVTAGINIYRAKQLKEAADAL